MIPRTAEIDARYVDHLHAEGVFHWGADWMEANIRVCNALMQAGYAPNDHKLLGAVIATKLCQWGTRA